MYTACPAVNESKIIMLTLRHFSDCVYIAMSHLLHEEKNGYLKKKKPNFNGTSKKQPVHEFNGHTVHTTIIAFTAHNKKSLSTYKYIPFFLVLECS